MQAREHPVIFPLIFLVNQTHAYRSPSDTELIKRTKVTDFLKCFSVAAKEGYAIDLGIGLQGVKLLGPHYWAKGRRLVSHRE